MCHLYRGTEQKPDVIVTKHIVLHHQQSVLRANDDEDKQRISIRRSHVFKDAARAFSKSTFNVSKLLKVTIVGEQSVDDGGPRRELFQVLMREAFTLSGLFVGWPCHVIPIHNIEAIANNSYYVVGKMISTSIVQGGQPPVCFATPVADFLVFNEVKCSPSLKDISDINLRHIAAGGKLYNRFLYTSHVTIYSYFRCWKSSQQRSLEN